MNLFDHVDMQEAKAKAIAGAKMAADHAGSKWKEDALQIVMDFSALYQGKLVLAEDIRKYAEESRKLPFPPDKRAWGHIFKKAQKLKLIEHAGFAPAVSSRGGAKSLWLIK